VFPLARAHPAVLRFILLTLARREEATGTRWREIDLTAGTWTVPHERTKNAEPHTVPLSRQATALLRTLGPGAADELIFRTFIGGPIGNWDRETKALQDASGTSGWTRHDLRRTGATMLGEMGELPDIIEAALNHVSIRSPLAATYNRSRYRPQVAAALQRLADALDGIEAGAAKVLQLRGDA
jgi:integrase